MVLARGLGWAFGNSGNGTANLNGQNENCLLSNTYLSKKTTCKARPLELRYTVHVSISHGCKIYSIASYVYNCTVHLIFFAKRLSDIKQ